MRIRFKSVALLAVLTLTAAGCQKDNNVEPTITIQQSVVVRNITYTIDGIQMHATIRGEHDWQVFIDHLLALSKKGHKVSVKDDGKYSNVSQAKDVVIFTTTSEEEANKWCNKMIEEGYEVWIEYDPETGKYTCTAVR